MNILAVCVLGRGPAIYDISSVTCETSRRRQKKRYLLRVNGSLQEVTLIPSHVRMLETEGRKIRTEEDRALLTPLVETTVHSLDH